MLRGLVMNGDFEAVGTLLKRLYPGGLNPGYDSRDLSAKMHVDSFRKPIEEWNPDNAPVRRGTDFNQYRQLAQDFYDSLG